ncbi:MAG: type II toxin-antitoxin system RelB/DinJ family antitoxin [Candidatus Andersenbacteria bacterium]
MKKTVVNFKTDPTVKRKAQAAAKQLGLSLSDVLNVLLRQFARDKELHASLEPTPYLERALEESKRDIEAGYVSPSFDSADDAIAWLDDPNSRYANGKRKVQ